MPKQRKKGRKEGGEKEAELPLRKTVTSLMDLLHLAQLGAQVGALAIGSFQILCPHQEGEGLMEK